jgi:hypothetical protein
MTGEEYGEALARAFEAKIAKRGDMTLTMSSLAAMLRTAARPEGYQESPGPDIHRQLEVAPEYPKLKILYDTRTGAALEQKIVHTVVEEIPYMSGGKDRPATRWYTRPMSEAVTT